MRLSSALHLTPPVSWGCLSAMQAASPVRYGVRPFLCRWLRRPDALSGGGWQNTSMSVQELETAVTQLPSPEVAHREFEAGRRNHRASAPFWGDDNARAVGNRGAVGKG